MSKSIIELMRKRFLFEGEEVQLTGRIAKKPSRRNNKVFFEVKSVNINNTGFGKRWVHINDMYEIFHPTRNNVEFATDLLDAVRRVMEKDDEGED